MSSGVRQGTSRDRRRRETREALVEAAYAGFCEHGYGRASLDAIAARAGFTKGALYAHFASKDELFLAVSAERSATLVGSLTEIGPADDVAARLGNWLATAVREHREWYLAITEFTLTAARDPAMAARLNEGHRTVADLLGGIAGVPGDLVMALVNGLFIQAADDPDLDVAGALTDGVTRLSREPR